MAIGSAIPKQTWPWSESGPTEIRNDRLKPSTAIPSRSQSVHSSVETG